MGAGASSTAPAENFEPLLQQEADVEAANHQSGSTRHDVGIVTVVSAAEAAAARGAAVAADMKEEDQHAARLERQADRAAAGERDHNVTGIALYALSTVFMSAMMVLVKLLGRWGISVFVVLVIRSLTVLCCALANLAKNRTNPWGNRRKLLWLRGFLGFGGNGGYFWTVTLLPLNDAIVLTFLAPAWVALLSPLLLRERPGRFTLFAIPVCILGVILIARPQLETDHHKAVLHAAGLTVGLFQAFFSGTAKMCVRELRSTEAPNVIVFYLAFISSMGALTGTIGQAIFFPGTLVFPTSFKEISTCLAVGALGYGAQITLTHGLRSAKAAPAIATSYLSVVWGIIASLYVFHETPTKESVAGAVLIIGCTMALGIFEHTNKKQPAPEPTVDTHPLLATNGSHASQHQTL